MPVVLVDTPAEAPINELDERYDVLVQCVPASCVMLSEPSAQAAVLVRTMSDRLTQEQLECCQQLSSSSPWSGHVHCGGWVSVDSHQALEHDSGQLWARVNVLARHSRRAAPAAGWLVCHETARR